MKSLILLLFLSVTPLLAQDLSIATEAELRLAIQERNRALAQAWVDSTTIVKAIVDEGHAAVIADTVSTDSKDHVRIWFNVSGTDGDRQMLLGLAKGILTAVPYVGREVGGDTVRVEFHEARRWATWMETKLAEAVGQ